MYVFVLPEIYFEGNRGLLNSPFLRDVLLYVNAHEPSGAAVPGILYSVSNVYLACQITNINTLVI